MKQLIRNKETSHTTATYGEDEGAVAKGLNVAGVRVLEERKGNEEESSWDKEAA